MAFSLLFIFYFTLHAPISSYAKRIYLTEKFPTVGDTYISSSEPLINYGNQEKNYLWDSQSEEYRILLAFEVKNIPDEAILSFASLTINWFYLPSRIVVNLYLISSFNESKVFWKSSPTFSSKFGSFNVTEEESAPSKWSITPVVNNNGYYYFGLSTSTSTTVYASIWAKEGVFGFSPKIEITYYTEDTDIPGFFLFISLLAIITLIRLRKKTKK